MTANMSQMWDVGTSSQLKLILVQSLGHMQTENWVFITLDTDTAKQ